MFVKEAPGSPIDMTCCQCDVLYGFILLDLDNPTHGKFIWGLCLTNAVIDLDIKRTVYVIHRRHLSLGNDQTLQKSATSLYSSDLFLTAVIIEY